MGILLTVNNNKVDFSGYEMFLDENDSIDELNKKLYELYENYTHYGFKRYGKSGRGSNEWTEGKIPIKYKGKKYLMDNVEVKKAFGKYYIEGTFDYSPYDLDFKITGTVYVKRNNSGLIFDHGFNLKNAFEKQKNLDYKKNNKKNIEEEIDEGFEKISEYYLFLKKISKNEIGKIKYQKVINNMKILFTFTDNTIDISANNYLSALELNYIYGIDCFYNKTSEEIKGLLKQIEDKEYSNDKKNLDWYKKLQRVYVLYLIKQDKGGEYLLNISQEDKDNIIKEYDNRVKELLEKEKESRITDFNKFIKKYWQYVTEILERNDEGGYKYKNVTQGFGDNQNEKERYIDNFSRFLSSTFGMNISTQYIFVILYYVNINGIHMLKEFDYEKFYKFIDKIQGFVNSGIDGLFQIAQDTSPHVYQKFINNNKINKDDNGDYSNEYIEKFINTVFPNYKNDLYEKIINKGRIADDEGLLLMIEITMPNEYKRKINNIKEEKEKVTFFEAKSNIKDFSNFNDGEFNNKNLELLEKNLNVIYKNRLQYSNYDEERSDYGRLLLFIDVNDSNNYIELDYNYNRNSGAYVYLNTLNYFNEIGNIEENIIEEKVYLYDKDIKNLLNYEISKSIVFSKEYLGNYMTIFNRYFISEKEKLRKIETFVEKEKEKKNNNNIIGDDYKETINQMISIDDNDNNYKIGLSELDKLMYFYNGCYIYKIDNYNYIILRSKFYETFKKLIYILGLNIDNIILTYLKNNDIIRIDIYDNTNESSKFFLIVQNIDESKIRK